MPSPPPPRAGIFSLPRRVSSYDVGPDHRLTVPGLLRQLHDTAQAHAAGYGFGYRGLAERGLAWALVCIDLGFRDPEGSRQRSAPPGESDYVASTAVHRSSGPIVLRDYRATDADGHVFAEGQSMWALIDLSTRRTAKPGPELRDLLTGIATDAINVVRTRRLPPVTNAYEFEHRRPVRLHDCDFNGHLNNVSAAQWMLDDLYDFLAARSPTAPGTSSGLSPKRLRLSYHAEALRGDTVRGIVSAAGDTYLAELRHDDGAPIATAAIEL